MRSRVVLWTIISYRMREKAGKRFEISGCLIWIDDRHDKPDYLVVLGSNLGDKVIRTI